MRAYIIKYKGYISQKKAALGAFVFHKHILFFFFSNSRENTVAQKQEQINLYELEIRQLKEQIHLKEKEYDEDIMKIKHQITAEQR